MTKTITDAGIKIIAIENILAMIKPYTLAL